MKISIILPCFNEAGNVERIADDLSELSRGLDTQLECIFVDNGSQDRTRQILQRLVKTHPICRMVALDVNQGFGGGIIAGAKVAVGDFIAIGAGDAQVPSETAMKAWELLKTDRYDYVKGYRLARQDGWVRRFISLCYNQAFAVLFGAPYKDINGPIKAMRREFWDRLDLVSRDWFLDAEIAIKVAKMPDVRFADFPVEWFQREAGESQVNWKTIWEFMRNMVLVKLFGLRILEKLNR